MNTQRKLLLAAKNSKACEKRELHWRRSLNTFLQQWGDCDHLLHKKLISGICFKQKKVKKVQVQSLPSINIKIRKDRSSCCCCNFIRLSGICDYLPVTIITIMNDYKCI